MKSPIESNAIPNMKNTSRSARSDKPMMAIVNNAVSIIYFIISSDWFTTKIVPKYMVGYFYGIRIIIPNRISSGRAYIRIDTFISVPTWSR